MVGCADLAAVTAGRAYGMTQIGRRKWRVQLAVFSATSQSHFHMVKLALDHTQRVLHIDAVADLCALDLVGQGIHLVSLVQQLAQAWLHGHMPLQIDFRGGPNVRTLVIGIRNAAAVLPPSRCVITACAQVASLRACVAHVVVYSRIESSSARALVLTQRFLHRSGC
jgi:hypothetical protein